MSYKEHENRARLVREAQNAFTRAAAALIEWPRDRSALPAAILEGSFAILKLAKADQPDERGLAEAVEVLHEIQKQRAERPA